jgi:hypothetical protein
MRSLPDPTERQNENKANPAPKISANLDFPPFVPQKTQITVK